MTRIFDSTQEEEHQQIDFIPGFDDIVSEDEAFQAFENGLSVCVDHKIHHDVHLVVQESWQRSLAMM